MSSPSLSQVRVSSALLPIDDIAASLFAEEPASFRQVCNFAKCRSCESIYEDYLVLIELHRLTGSKNVITSVAQLRYPNFAFFAGNAHVRGLLNSDQTSSPTKLHERGEF